MGSGGCSRSIRWVVGRARDRRRIAEAKLHGTLCRLADLDWLPHLTDTERRLEHDRVVAAAEVLAIEVDTLGGDARVIRYQVDHRRAQAIAVAGRHPFSDLPTPADGFTSTTRPSGSPPPGR